MFIAIEKEDANKVDFNKTVNRFAKMKTRRYKFE